MARQPGSKGLTAGAVRAAIYDAALQDDAGLSYDPCRRVRNSASQSFSIMRDAIQFDHS